MPAGIINKVNMKQAALSRGATLTSVLLQARWALLISFFVLAIVFLIKSPAAKSADSLSYSRTFKQGAVSVGSKYLGGGPRIAKVTMLYGERPNPLYERAVRSHQAHNEKWNYPMYVLREEIAGGYWNKPSYLLSLIVQELAKPRSERLEWLMWVDADLIVINPSIPLSIFLPPAHLFPDTHFLGNKDQNGLNTGTFLIRVNEWSVKMLAKAIAMPMYKPDEDLGVSMDQQAMFRVFNDTSPPKYPKEEKKDGQELSEAEKRMRKQAQFGVGGSNGEVLYQPRVWYNTYEWHHAYEGKQGNLLVHFPGLEDDRWQHMSDWLDVVENTPAKWDVPLDQTTYPAEVKDFYDGIIEAKKTLHIAQDLVGEREYDEEEREAVDFLRQACDTLRAQIRWETDLVNKTAETTRFIQGLLPADEFRNRKKKLLDADV